MTWGKKQTKGENTMHVALITGGMGGLGESISTKMHAAGYRVAVTHSPGNAKVKEWLVSHKASGASSAPILLTWRILIRARNASVESPKMSDQSISWSTTRELPATQHSRR